MRAARLDIPGLTVICCCLSYHRLDLPVKKIAMGSVIFKIRIVLL